MEAYTYSCTNVVQVCVWDTLGVQVLFVFKRSLLWGGQVSQQLSPLKTEDPTPAFLIPCLTTNFDSILPSCPPWNVYLSNAGLQLQFSG